jgi:hypothetical protein
MNSIKYKQDSSISLFNGKISRGHSRIGDNFNNEDDKGGLFKDYSGGYFNPFPNTFSNNEDGLNPYLVGV